MTDRLPSWRPGPTRDTIIGFLDAVGDVPVDDRVAYFDNDGTLWCERPSYVQLDFFVDALRRRVETDPDLADRLEFAALLDGDAAALGKLGLERIAMALTGLFDGMEAEDFADAVTGVHGSERNTAPSAARSAASCTSRCSSCSTNSADSTSRSGWSPAAAPSSFGPSARTCTACHPSSSSGR